MSKEWEYQDSGGKWHSIDNAETLAIIRMSYPVRPKSDLHEAELAAHRYDGLGAPMYRPHIAEMRRQILGPNFNGRVMIVSERFSCEPVDEMLAATRETQGQPVDAAPRKGKHTATCECPECWQQMER